MYVQVRCLNAYDHALWYKIPPGLCKKDPVGTVVHVPLRNRVVPAVIIHAQQKTPRTHFIIKAIERQEPFPEDPHYHAFLTRLAAYQRIDSHHFIKRLASFLGERVHRPFEAQKKEEQARGPVALTDEQEAVVSFLLPRIAQGVYSPTVLHGVTASGKTEVYKELLISALAQSKSALFMLPEVTLALEFERRLQRELGAEVPIYGFHSGTTPREKYAAWQHLIAGTPIIVIGVHLPVLLPIANLGLIIVDEEHDAGYQEKKHPKVHSRDAAVMRAYGAGIPIVLGSATPSLSTLHNVNARDWNFFRLKKRFSGSFPNVSLAFLSDKAQRKNFWISTKLYYAIKKRLSCNEQAIIFLNRRGLNFFVQCSSCSTIFSCASCSVSLTLHEGDMLLCHYCGHTSVLPNRCNACQAGKESLLKKGIGTQRVVSILQDLFPQARIARADLDTTIKKKRWEETVRDFHAGAIDILVGTQTITKGYDFPRVTLVGILWADLNLNFPVYNASEVTLQQLIQVAGRAGRQSAESEVIVQAMGEHPIFNYLSEQDYLQFYAHELAVRRELAYPPCGRLALVTLRHSEESVVAEESQKVAALLYDRAQNLPDVRILGPASPPVHRIKGLFFRTIYCKAPTVQYISRVMDVVDPETYQSVIYFTPNPVS